MQRPINADVILPVTAVSPLTYCLSMTAIRTCRASTSARLLVMDNNTERQEWRDALRETCELLGATYTFTAGPFSMSAFWNRGAAMTSGEYIAYAGADAIYFPDWLENIIDLWEEHPEYFVLVPYSFDFRNFPVCRKSVNPVREIIQNHNPAGAVQVFKRSSGWIWDEQFPLWEMDADVTYYLERNRLKGGYVCNARVDHLVGQFSQNIDTEKHYGIKDFYGEPSLRLKAKWGLK